MILRSLLIDLRALLKDLRALLVDSRALLLDLRALLMIETCNFKERTNRSHPVAVMYNFSKVSSIVPLHRKYTTTLTFDNFCF